MSKLTMKELLATAEGVNRQMRRLDKLCTKIQHDAAANYIATESMFRFKSDLNSLNRNLYGEPNQEAGTGVSQQVAALGPNVMENTEQLPGALMPNSHQPATLPVVGSNADAEKQYDDNILNISGLSENNDEMTVSMPPEADADDEEDDDDATPRNKESDEITRLKWENQMLRDMLKIPHDRPLLLTDWKIAADLTKAAEPSDVLPVAGVSNQSMKGVDFDGLANASANNTIEPLGKLSLEEEEGSGGDAAAPSPN